MKALENKEFYIVRGDRSGVFLEISKNAKEQK